MGVPVTVLSETNTALATVKGRDEVLLELAQRPWLNKVHVQPAHPTAIAFGVPRHVQVPSAAMTLNAHWAFNDIFVHGTGERLGILDAVAPRCQIFDEHEAFSRSPGIHYQDTLRRSCTRHSDCRVCDIVSANSLGLCRDGRCVSDHTTGAAGAMISYQSCGNASHDYCAQFTQPTNCTANSPQYAECDPVYQGSEGFMASQAELFFANAATHINEAELTAAYNWLLGKGVQIVAEPWAIGPGPQAPADGDPTAQDIVQDNYT